MTGSAPWSRNAGKFSQPSSGLPQRSRGEASSAATSDDPRAYHGVESVRSKTRLLDKREADIRHAGVIAVGAETILIRIDEAMTTATLRGLGNTRGIYLIEADWLAFREAQGGHEFCDIKVSIGKASKVYARNGSVTILKHGRGLMRERREPTSAK